MILWICGKCTDYWKIQTIKKVEPSKVAVPVSKTSLEGVKKWHQLQP